MQVIEYRVKKDSPAKLTQNPLSGDWFVEGQKNESVPYMFESFKPATQVLQSVEHFNATGEVKKFSPISKRKLLVTKTIR